MPATTRASPSVELIVVLGYSGHDRNVLPALYPAIGTCIGGWKALVYPRLLRTNTRSQGLRLRFQFFRLSCLMVELLPVLQQSFRDFLSSACHA